MGQNGAVNNETKWVNQFQPQTLVIATFLLYINAFFWVINLIQGFPPEIAVLAAVAMGLGGWGIANEKRWAYFLAIFGAVLNVGWPYMYGRTPTSSRSCSGSLSSSCSSTHEPRLPTHLVQVARVEGPRHTDRIYAKTPWRRSRSAIQRSASPRVR